VDLGLLLTLPVESVAVRVVLASAVGVVLVRFLLRAGVRSVSARVAMALAPATALVAVVLISSRGGLQLPSLMLPADAVDALPIPVTDGYLHFAPIAAPLLASVWAIVAGVRLARRVGAHRHARRAAAAARAEGPVPPALQATVARLAADLRVAPPEVALAETCAGGAYVVGTRRPTIVIGRDLLDRLDAEELDGVLAHELAHVRRRDNLVATVLGTVRDLAFFVPGGGWAVSQLHRERERAADDSAVAATGRPAALASGLLKTLEGAEPLQPCAALAPSASLVERVTELIEERPPVSRVRRGVELGAVGGTAVVAVVVAVALPATLAGPERQRDAVAVVWSANAASADQAPTAVPEPRAFDVYRGTRLEVVDGPAAEGRDLGPDTSSVEDRPSTWRACAAAATCPTEDEGVGLGLVPRPTIALDDDLPWQATPAFPTGPAGDGLRLPTVYWLQRVE
jgi:Zn-dependent protease with chaperone function